MPDKAYWKQRYYDDYVAQVKAAGGTPVDRTAWENHVTDDRMDETAKSFLTSELGKISTDTATKKLQDEYQAGLDKTIADLQTSGNQRISSVKSERQNRMSQLAALLGKEADRQFSLDAPEILEQLNTRGLLKSSATGEAMAREKANLQEQVNAGLSRQELADLDYEQQLANDIFNSTMGLKTKGMDYIANLSAGGQQRKFNLDDIANETKAAWDLNIQNENAAKEAQDKQLLSDIIQTGTSVATMGLASPSQSDTGVLDTARKKKTAGVNGLQYASAD